MTQLGAWELDSIQHTDLFALCDGLPDASVDCIICDPPYGTTSCAWDSVIPFAPMWERFKRIIKPRGAIVLTASQPFTSALVMSNPKMFKYCWYWEKPKGANFALTGFQPLKVVEDIAVFSFGASTYTVNENGMPYYPQKTRMERPYTRDFTKNNRDSISAPLRNAKLDTISYSENTPRNLLYASQIGDERLHPTQKPVALFRYLIRTYTRAGELVLDPCVGSGTTAVAAAAEGRNYLCGDTSLEYVEIARARVAGRLDEYQAKSEGKPYTLSLFAEDV